MGLVKTACWWLPRPRKNKFPGGFPLRFEERLYKLLGLTSTKRVLHPFGGAAEYGTRCDIRPEVRPDHVLDAHSLPKEWTDQWEAVVLDPPYSNDEAAEIYGTPKLQPSKYIAEAVRVCKPGGYVVHYHRLLAPLPDECDWVGCLTVLTRVWHGARVVCIWRKRVVSGVSGAEIRVRQSLRRRGRI